MADNHKIEEKVMGEIKSGRVKLRSRYIFLAEKLGLGSAFMLSVILAVLFLNLALFYLRASDNLMYLSFGSHGVFAFLESFPYLLVISVIVFIFIAGFIAKKSGASYKRPFGYLAVALVGFITLAGVGLAFTSVSERIERESFGPRPFGRVFRPFLGAGMDERHMSAVGRVVEAGEGFINIQAPFGVQKIDLSQLEVRSEEALTAGMFIIAVGENTDDVFIAQSMRVMQDEDMPMIRRGVHRRFGEFDARRLPAPPPDAMRFDNK